MKGSKERLTVTVDRALLQAAKQAVASGQADSLSGWVNLALAERAAKERRLRAMADAIARFEREFGEISAGELEEQARDDLRSAAVVRDRPDKRRRRRAA